MRDEVTTKDVLIALRSCTGLLHIEVIFNGEGDSGQINDIHLRGIADEEIKDMPLPPELAALYDPSEAMAVTVQAFIETWCYDEIQRVVDFDWYNNDGGGGTITIEPYTGLFKIDAYQNIVSTEAHNFDESLEGPEFTKLTDEERAVVDG